MTGPAGRRHILTIAVEDWFQVGSFHEIVQEGRWYRFETRVERNVRRALDLLDRHGATATFFTLGWVAERMPDLVREIVERGHEIASKGYYHRSLRDMTPDEFREDLARARAAIENATGRGVLGYRIADDWLRPEDLWALEVLQQEGYAYDSSIFPMFDRWRREPHRRFPHRQPAGDGEIWEIPLSTVRFLGVDLPVAGGNWYRQFPHRLMRHAFRRVIRETDKPFVMYFQVWELDPDQPTLGGASFLTRIRHYRNLGKLAWVLPEYLAEARFVSVADWLGLEVPVVEGPVSSAVPRSDAPESAPAGGRPITVVVPCFNEELVLPYLARTLEAVESEYAGIYEFRYVFVDDCSTDGTLPSLQEIFGGRPECRIVRHAANRGVAHAILTGLREADTEIVASIDCDCTYDPHQLGNLIPRIAEADLVTASPYHERGEVRNVPGWRLCLSRGLSRLYRRVLRCQLATYTSCFRVYRRSSTLDLPIREGGFLGVAETLGILDLRGYRVVECPAVLEVRMLGRSKMKVLKTIAGHLRLLVRLGVARLAGTHRAVRHSRVPAGAPPVRALSLHGASRPEGKPDE